MKVKCQYCGKEVEENDQEKHEMKEHDWCMSKDQADFIKQLAFLLERFYCGKRFCSTCPYRAEHQCPSELLKKDLSGNIVQGNK